MQTIHSLEELKNLNLPTAIYLQLIQQLTEPFDGDLEATTTFWKETSTLLDVLNADDQLDARANDPHGIRQLIEFALTYPEQVSSLVGVDGDINDDADNKAAESYLLVLAITSDDGAGTYLLLPSDHPEYSNLINQQGAY